MRPQPTVVITKVIRFWSVRMIMRTARMEDHLGRHDQHVLYGEGSLVDGGCVQHDVAVDPVQRLVNGCTLQ